MVVAVLGSKLAFIEKGSVLQPWLDYRTNLNIMFLVVRDCGVRFPTFHLWLSVVLEIAKGGMRKMVGNGASTLFWLNCWLGDECRRDRFPRLFSIST